MNESRRDFAPAQPAILMAGLPLPANRQLRTLLRHVYWVGGSPCSGKSSIVSLLARRYGLQEYHCDDHYEEHLQRADPDRHPRLFNARNVTWDEVWMHPVDYLVAREFAFYREEFEMVVADLLSLPAASPIIAEGAALLPECVAPLLTDPSHAIWVVPTEEFQRKAYAGREWVADILGQCSRPQEAWENWMGRDAGFARQVKQEAISRGLAVLQVDGSRSIEENAAVVEAQFALGALHGD